MPTDGLRWRTVAADLQREIRAGLHPVGTRLPSVRQLMDQHGVSDRTVLRALKQLRDEELVEARAGSGHWVVRSEPLPDVERRLASLEARVERLERERDA